MGGKITDVMIQKTMAVTTAERNEKGGLTAPAGATATT